VTRLPSLRAARLRLDPWAQHEVDAVHALLTDPGMRRFLLDGEIIAREQAATFIAAHLALAAERRVGTWALRLEPGGAMIGFCGLRPAPELGELELLYGLLPAHWNQGLATEAARAVLQHLWRATTVERVFARADAPNRRSVAVMQRVGMQPHAAPGPLVTFVLPRPAGD